MFLRRVGRPGYETNKSKKLQKPKVNRHNNIIQCPHNTATYRCMMLYTSSWSGRTNLVTHYNIIVVSVMHRGIYFPLASTRNLCPSTINCYSVFCFSKKPCFNHNSSILSEVFIKTGSKCINRLSMTPQATQVSLYHFMKEEIQERLVSVF